MRQLVRLEGAKLEQGVERHTGDNLQEVIDFRYFKITVLVDGRELKLQLRFDKYREYKEWGIVLLQATLPNQVLLEQITRQQLIDQADVSRRRQQREKLNGDAPREN